MCGRFVAMVVVVVVVVVVVCSLRSEWGMTQAFQVPHYMKRGE